MIKILNLMAILSNFIFIVALKNLPPEFKSYIDGPLLIIIIILLAGPFVINLLSGRSMSLTKPKISSALLFGLVAITLFCLIFMYQDQLETSRGFALLGCVGVYLFLFLPGWIIYLNMCRNKVGTGR